MKITTIFATLALSLSGLAHAGPVLCSFQAYDGHYLTAVGGGGRTSDVIHTDATKVGSWERFELIDLGPSAAGLRRGIRTASGNYLSAVSAGGRVTDVLHSNAVSLQEWETFTLVQLSNYEFAIRTYNGHYLTAVNSGGLTQEAIHSDATRIGTWETFRLKCLRY